MKIYKSEFHGECPICKERVTVKVVLIDLGIYKPIHLHMKCKKCGMEIAV